MSYKLFSGFYKLKSGPYVNPFDSGQSKGLVIRQVNFERSETDDDWVILELAGTNLAISPSVAHPPSK